MREGKRKERRKEGRREWKKGGGDKKERERKMYG